MAEPTYTIKPYEKFASQGQILTFLRMFLYSNLSFSFIITSFFVLVSSLNTYPSNFLNDFLYYYLHVGICAGVIMGVLFGIPASYLYRFMTLIINASPTKEFLKELEDKLAKMGYILWRVQDGVSIYKPSLFKNSIFAGKLTIQKDKENIIITGSYSSIRRLINNLGLVEYKENKEGITEELKLQLLPGERVLFYSPNRDRWENYRFDLMAYITIGMSFIAYLISFMILMFTFDSDSYTGDFSDLLSIVGSFMIIVIFVLFDKIAIDTIIIAKHNYPLVLTNKRIITERDFLKKKKPIGTFIEGAEKVAYIEATRREAYVYFKKDGEIKRVPLSYLSRYREDFKRTLRELFGEKYMEAILWEMKVPLKKEFVEDIFRDGEGGE